MWPYSWTHVGTPSHLGHMDRVAATMPSQAHAGAAQEAPTIGQWEGQDVPLVRPSSCTVKGGIPSSRRYLPTYLPGHWVSYCCVALVFGSGFRNNPANPDWGPGCVCLDTGLSFTPPFLAGVCGVCGWAWVFGLRPANPDWGFDVCVFVCTPPVPRHSWLECAVRSCVLGFGFLAAPRHSLLGFWVVCFGVCALSGPHHSWLGRAVSVDVLGFRCRLRPTILGWGVGLCVLVCVLRLYPANPGSGVRCGCVCLGLGCSCAPPFLAGVLGRMCLCVCTAFSSPFLARVCGVAVCAWLRVSAAPPDSWLGNWVVCFGVCALSGPRHSRLGCAVCVCVLELGLRLRPVFPGWSFGGMCLCARSACSPPVLARVCGVGVCALIQVSAAPRHSWLGFCVVCIGVCALSAPCQSWFGCTVWVWVL